MYLMLDITVNNLATANPPNSSAATAPHTTASSDGAQEFHPLCSINDYDNQTQVEQCWVPADGVQTSGGANGTNATVTAGVWFPDVNTDEALVVSEVLAASKAAVKQSGADGVRIGSVKHIGQDFWPGFRNAVGVFTLGEVWSRQVLPFCLVIYRQRVLRR